MDNVSISRQERNHKNLSPDRLSESTTLTLVWQRTACLREDESGSHPDSRRAVAELNYISRHIVLSVRFDEHTGR